MRQLLFILFFCLVCTSPALAQSQSYYSGLGLQNRHHGPDVSEDYLDQARDYRDAGRLELARQSYALALSTCLSTTNLEIIKREMDAVELMLRSLR